MKSNSGIRKLALRVLTACLALFFAIFMAVPTWTVIREKWEISSQLRSATSVKLIHYESRPESEKIYAIRELTGEDVQRVERAFPLLPDIGFPVEMYNCAPNPHHRIEITDTSGQVLTIRVCFLCDHVRVGDGQWFLTPLAWRTPLRDLFKDGAFSKATDDNQ